ncbi:MAG: PspC domain-containing protein [Haloechinothrix sp.]
MSGTAGPQPPRLAGFEDTVRDFWASRPRRPRHGRKCAGVAAAVGNRYRVDPVLVRVALIVATVIGGFGLLIYLLGWLFFPEEGDEVSGAEALLGRGHSSMSTGLTVVLCVALVPVATGTLGGMWFHGGGFIGLALLGAGLYLLHRNRGRYNRPVTPVVGTAGAAPASFHAETASADAAVVPPSGDTAEATTPPAWDPLGAAPFAWDLPDPAPSPALPAPREPRRGSKIGPATVGLALLVAGVGVALSIAGVVWFSPGHIIGLTLAVLGLGMVVGAFTHGGRGLMLLAVPLSIAGLVLTTVPFAELPRGGWGMIDETPRSAAELQPRYERSGGSIELDLTRLPPAAEYRTEVTSAMGTVEVTVPPDADVTFTCTSSMGNVNCLGRNRSGMGDQTVAGTDYGADGPGGQKFVLDLSSRMGTVEMRRG